MIAAWMAYAFVIAALVSAAALIAERIALLRRLPSRWVWVSALLLSVVLPVLFAWQGASSVEPAKALVALATNEAPPMYARSPIAWVGGDTVVVTRSVPIDVWLLAGWAVLSTLVLAVLAMGWLQREDYDGFDKWFEEKCLRQHRDCWIIDIDNRLAGLVIRKDETHAEARTVHPGQRILKICTFKISPDFRGEKLGEHLLKKVLWFAQANRYDVVYLTAFAKQDFLVALLLTFGFEVTRTLGNGELMVERSMHHGSLITLPASTDPLSHDFSIYPRYYDGSGVGKFVVPIQWQYHIVLFPEIAEAAPLPLFPSDRFVVEADVGSDRTPGNTIRKVYVCRAQTRQLRPGAVLLFYLSKSDMNRSQHVTSIGVVEQTQLAASLTDLMRAVGRRSVYSQRDLAAMNPHEASPVLVIDFLLIGHLEPPVPLATLLSTGVFSSRPPQSISSVAEAAFERLKPSLKVSFV